jgi:hypothetical protein
MEKSYLDSKTFGIGQLISQRKLLRVPEHQRDFSWEEQDVRQFLEDVIGATETGAPDYFVGLIVLLGPHDNAWQILDGQQRLATVTMIYSAIRHWLSNREGYAEDAEQIASEFIALRKLGGGQSPRLVLNVENQSAFFELVVERCPDDELMRQVREAPKRSSKRLLAEAARLCRSLVGDYAANGASNTDEQALRLFELVTYLEERVKVVVLDVVSETNAFIIFESLNARGNELSALDLVKNHIFGNAGAEGMDQVRPLWAMMAERIEDKDADDFLRVFWTSRFGRVQKRQLYERIKAEFAGQAGALGLASELAAASERYLALDDPSHEVWSTYGPVCSRWIEALELLGNRQVRVPIMAAIGSFDQEKMESLLWLLTVLTVRYQTVGRRRTGALEITCARMANLVWQGQLRTDADLWDSVRSIMPTDEEFRGDFLRYSEKTASRVAYFLGQLEKTFRQTQGLEARGLDEVSHHPSDADVIMDFVLPREPSGEWSRVLQTDPGVLDERLFRLGNRCLLEAELDDHNAKPLSFGSAARFYAQSEFLLTKMVADEGEWGRRQIESRQVRLTDLAVQTWPLRK